MKGMNRREFSKGFVAAASAAALGRALAQKHEPTGDAELDRRQSEIDALAPDDFKRYLLAGTGLSEEQLSSYVEEFPALGRLEAAFANVLREVKETVVTDVILHIRPDGEEADEFSQYTREYPIYKLVRKYSDYVRYPIRMLMPHPYLKEGTGIKKEDGTDIPPEYEEKMEMETFNSMVPIWHRKKADVTNEEYESFYKETFRETEPPLSVIPVSVEGAITYEALLFIPKKAPANYFSDEYKPGLQLYSSGVMIMDSCEDLLPDYFNFVRGVVESPDLTLNVSREVLQHDRQLKAIGSHLEKKVRAELDRMLKDDRENYSVFWKEFGRQIKVCCLEDYGAKKDRLEDLLLFYSSKEKQFVKLEEYFERM